MQSVAIQLSYSAGQYGFVLLFDRMRLPQYIINYHTEQFLCLIYIYIYIGYICTHNYKYAKIVFDSRPLRATSRSAFVI